MEKLLRNKRLKRILSLIVAVAVFVTGLGLEQFVQKVQA